MNNNNNINTLAKHLEQEINWVEELNVLLSEEKTMLATNQVNLLEELANKKQALSGKIEESAKDRIELINSSNSTKDIGLSLKEFLSNCSTEQANQINKLNKQLFEQLATCRELNTVNGQVISHNIHTRQQIVNALSGNHSDAVSVYTATGNIQSAPDTKHHQEA
jgi:flagella synthesis protein FlgN